MASAENRLPRLVEGLDLKLLPIGPTEAFVLSRVDGTSSEADIAEATGLSLETVSRTLSRLVGLGAVLLSAKSDEAVRPYRRPLSSSGQFALGGAASEPVIRIEHPGAALEAPKPPEEGVDLDAERQRQILETFQKLDRKNHYELFGISTQADRREIKARYYEMINQFHPDRYYGKRLGSFKSRLERIFQRVSEAHEVLIRTESRAEYDRYLNISQDARALEQQLHDEEAHERELESVRARIEAEARAAGLQPSIPGAKSPALDSSIPPLSPIRTAIQSSQPPLTPSFIPSAPSGTPPSPPSDSSPSSTPKADSDSRRRALARKLGFSSPPPADPRPSRVPPPPPPLEVPAAHQRAAQDLKRRYDDRMLDARRRQIHEYLTRADAALAERKLVDAVNALRIAVSLAPDDPVLRQRLEDLQIEAGKELADRYVEQAEYEEREKHWAEAARSYARALGGKPSPRLYERMAFCLLSSQGDVKQALEHARKAVLAAPNEAKYRVTLARAYLAANMKESAIGEFERATTLAPADDTIKELLRRVRRGEL